MTISLSLEIKMAAQGDIHFFITPYGYSYADFFKFY